MTTFTTQDRQDAERDGKCQHCEDGCIACDSRFLPLTDQDLLKMAADKFHYTEYKLAIEFARAIERAHGIGE